MNLRYIMLFYIHISFELWVFWYTFTKCFCWKAICRKIDVLCQRVEKTSPKFTEGKQVWHFAQCDFSIGELGQMENCDPHISPVNLRNWYITNKCFEKKVVNLHPFWSFWSTKKPNSSHHLPIWPRRSDTSLQGEHCEGSDRSPEKAGDGSQTRYTLRNLVEFPPHKKRGGTICYPSLPKSSKYLVRIGSWTP